MYVILTLFLFAKMMLNLNDIGWIMIEYIFDKYISIIKEFIKGKYQGCKELETTSIKRGQIHFI